MRAHVMSQVLNLHADLRVHPFPSSNRSKDCTVNRLSTCDTEGQSPHI